jgi:hypothetical protein
LSERRHGRDCEDCGNNKRLNEFHDLPPNLDFRREQPCSRFSDSSVGKYALKINSRLRKGLLSN